MKYEKQIEPTWAYILSARYLESINSDFRVSKRVSDV